jgi:hypothetical protein
MGAPMPKIKFGKTFREVGLNEVYQNVKSCRNRVLADYEQVKILTEKELDEIITSIEVGLREKPD